MVRSVLGGLLLAVAAASCGAPSDPSPIATTTVDLPKSYRFDPAAITIEAGSTVTWTNNDNFTHTVAFMDEDPLRMSPGERVSRRFDDPGTFPYVCSLHPNDMRGTVVVTG